MPTLNDTIRELTSRLNAFKEQNDMLQGSIQVLQATNENLQTNNDKYKEELATYKKTFNEVFIKNIGNAWEKFDDKEKDTMSLSNKAGFLSKEINLSKIYIRDSLEKKYKKILAEDKSKFEDLKKENNLLKKKLSMMDSEFANDVNNSKKRMENNIKKNPSDILSNDEHIETTSSGANTIRTSNGSSSLGMDKIASENRINNKKNGIEKVMHDTSEIKEPPSSREDINNIVKQSILKKELEERKKERKKERQSNNETFDFLDEKQFEKAIRDSGDKLTSLNYSKKYHDLSEYKKKEVFTSVNDAKLNLKEINFICRVGKSGYFRIEEINTYSMSLPKNFSKEEISNEEFIKTSYLVRNSLISKGFVEYSKEIKIKEPNKKIQTIALTEKGFFAYLFLSKLNPNNSRINNIF